VAHACNPSYPRGRDQEDHGLKPAQANSSQDPILKKTHHTHTHTHTRLSDEWKNGRDGVLTTPSHQLKLSELNSSYWGCSAPGYLITTDYNGGRGVGDIKPNIPMPAIYKALALSPRLQGAKLWNFPDSGEGAGNLGGLEKAALIIQNLSSVEFMFHSFLKLIPSWKRKVLPWTMYVLSFSASKGKTWMSKTVLEEWVPLFPWVLLIRLFSL
jgi:hypothetical protein